MEDVLAVYTPEHGSWLDIAEIELSVLKRQCLAARLADTATVRRQVTAWQARRNQQQVRDRLAFYDR